MVTETDYAWAAGFVDGDGCISLYLHSGVRHKYANVAVIVVQKDISPLEHFKVVFGVDNKIGVTRRGKHTYFRLSINGQSAKPVLEKMLPYLVLKKTVAETALALLASKDEAHKVELIKKGMYLNSGRWAAAETKSNSLPV